MQKKPFITSGVILLVLAVFIISLPGIARVYWRIRSDNPVREGMKLAGRLGCFTCHGELGGNGIPDPGSEEKEVPMWSGGVWMMYVKDDQDIREFITDGISKKRLQSVSAAKERETDEIHMPAFKRFLKGDDVENLVSMFKVVSGMNLPPGGSAARRGYETARSFECFACHGPGACGGLPNPGSFSGFIPGWYGADFRDLVRNRGEFIKWIKEGKIERLQKNPIARYFMGNQRIKMPRYGYAADGDIDALWEYAMWLDATRGGTEAGQ